MCGLTVSPFVAPSRNCVYSLVSLFGRLSVLPLTHDKKLHGALASLRGSLGLLCNESPSGNFHLRFWLLSPAVDYPHTCGPWFRGGNEPGRSQCLPRSQTRAHGAPTPPCGSVVSTAQTPSWLQTGICSLGRPKPLTWSIWNVFVTLPKQLIRFYFHLSVFTKRKALWLPYINVQPELL